MKLNVFFRKIKSSDGSINTLESKVNRKTIDKSLSIEAKKLDCLPSSVRRIHVCVLTASFTSFLNCRVMLIYLFRRRYFSCSLLLWYDKKIPMFFFLSRFYLCRWITFDHKNFASLIMIVILWRLIVFLARLWNFQILILHVRRFFKL